MRDDTILVGGYSHFPCGVTAHEVYRILGIGLEIDPKTGEIVNVASTFITEMTHEFIKSVLLGQNINNKLDKPIEAINKRYFGKGKKAIIAALLDAYSSYEKYLSNKFDM